MSLYGHLYRNLWRLRAGRLGRDIFSEAVTMAARERLSSKELVVYQMDRLKALLAHAYRQVPFWRMRMDEAGLNLETVQSREDLMRLPLLTKDEVRAQGRALIAETQPSNGLTANATGGSTGEPLHFWQGRRYLITNRAAKLRYRRWYGYDFGERIVYLWGAHRDTAISGLRGWLRRQLRQERWVNAFELDEATMLGLVELLNRWQPRLLVAYPSALEAFARFVQQKGLRVHPPGAIECSAEKLWPEQRQEIEAALHAPIFDVYGSREFGTIAAECPAHQGLHLFADTHLVEVIRNGRPAESGEVGEIVVTCLTNYAMPFIRYRTGDLGTLGAEPCGCGRTLPLLKEVVGRSNALVSLPNGRLVHGAFFSYFFYHEPGVRRYRVHQHGPEGIQVLLEGDGTLTPQRVQEMTKNLRESLGNSIAVTITPVSRIAPLPSGKLGYLVSEVPINFADEPIIQKDTS